MKGYSILHVFNTHERRLRYAAERIVRCFPDAHEHATLGPNAWVRCHEVARAVGRILGLEVQDGYYGAVDHSWCRISRSSVDEMKLDSQLFPIKGKSPYREAWTVLDVYTIGRLPQVQLVSGVVGIRDYVASTMRSDIDLKLVDHLVKLALVEMKLWTKSSLESVGLDRNDVRAMLKGDVINVERR